MRLVLMSEPSTLNGQMYNLCLSYAYARVVAKAPSRPSQAALGGSPDRARLDSMHQGDCDKVKGVYHINRVDEVTQCQFTTCGERISGR